MIKNRIISIFLLGLLLLVNWHNASFHAHEGPDGNDFSYLHDHDHDHHHHSDHSHDSPGSDIFSWLQQLLGDFEHADLGEDHFKVFLHPQQTGANHAIEALPVACAILSLPICLTSWQPLEENILSDRVRSFSDPPFLEIVANRGPPSFS